MNEWCIFTKDGEDYCGNHIERWYEFVVLFSLSRRKVVEERTWLSRLFSPSFWFCGVQVKHDDIKAYDYMIPVTEILRIERHDVS